MEFIFLWGHLKFYMTLLIDQFHYWGLAFGGYGIYMLLKDKKYIGLLLLLSIIFSGPFLSVLMGNVRPTTNMYFISERFYLGSLGLFAILVSYGIYNVLSFLQKTKYGKIGSIAIIISIGIFMLYHFTQTYPSQDKSNDYLQYDFIENILMTADKNAILMTSNENIVFGIWYMQAVEGRRKDIKPFLGTSFPPRLEALRKKMLSYFKVFHQIPHLRDWFSIILMGKTTGTALR